jgi:hypothetical protein
MRMPSFSSIGPHSFALEGVDKFDASNLRLSVNCLFSTNLNVMVVAAVTVQLLHFKN